MREIHPNPVRRFVRPRPKHLVRALAISLAALALATLIVTGPRPMSAPQPMAMTRAA